ncbi:MAG: YciI family protein [Acidobacteria bacterium]|nr:YciI family protein [Acidobacteriota bacterium]
MTDPTRDSDEIPELRSLARDTAPPPELEDQVVAELRREGLLGAAGGRFRVRFVRAALAAAASMALFVTGWFAASRQQSGPEPEAQPSYALLLRPGPDYREGTEADEQQRVKEYGAWARGLYEKGQLISGEKLNDNARTLIARNGTVAFLEQPGGEPGPVQGLFLIRAASMDRALEIARGCPHLRHGGVIEVRPIDPT